MDGLDIDKLEYHYKNSEDFEILLLDVDDACYKGTEEEFYKKMRDKFKLYGLKMYITEAQLRWLKQIASRNY